MLINTELTSSTRKTPLDGIDIESWFIHIDEKGFFVDDAQFKKMIQIISDKKVTDVIFFSHGWNNSYDTAKTRYTDFMRKWKEGEPKNQTNRNLFFIGVFWPSIWFKDFSLTANDSSNSSVLSESDMSDFIAALEENAINPLEINKIKNLLNKYSLTENEVLNFFDISLKVFPSKNSDDILYKEKKLSSQNLVSILKGIHREIYNDKLAINFNPIDILRIFSVWKMKDRAGAVGGNGVAFVLNTLLKMQRKPKIHLIGHSFGCKVMLSALIKKEDTSRPVTSILLLQPAISHLCFTNEDIIPGVKGGYNIALNNSHVSLPILTTYSKLDKPLHLFYHLALIRREDIGELIESPSIFAALGGYGPRKTKGLLVKNLPKPGEIFSLSNGYRIYGFDGSDNQINSHGDVTSRETAWLLSLILNYSSEM